jgi:hypothetical protein
MHLLFCGLYIANNKVFGFVKYGLNYKQVIQLYTQLLFITSICFGYYLLLDLFRGF